MRHVLALLLLAAPAHAMTIVPTWDASVTGNPNATAIETAVATAMTAYTSVFTNPVTVNINVGWGEVGGVTMPGNYAGQSEESVAGLWTYAQIRALPTFSGLPAKPVGPSFFEVTRAEGKALGLVGTSSNQDGSIGLNTSLSGASLIGVAEHEIAEVLGRDSTVTTGYEALQFPADLFRFSAPGVHSYGYSTPSYFSLTNGYTNLGWFDNSTDGGDRGDWLTGYGPVPGDLQNAVLSGSTLSAVDLAYLEAIGWTSATSNHDYVPIHEPPVWTLLGSFFAIIFLARRLDK